MRFRISECGTFKTTLRVTHFNPVHQKKYGIIFAACADTSIWVFVSMKSSQEFARYVVKQIIHLAKCTILLLRFRGSESLCYHYFLGAAPQSASLKLRIIPDFTKCPF